MNTREQWVELKAYCRDHATGNVDELLRYLEPHVLAGYTPHCLGDRESIEFGEQGGGHGEHDHEPNLVVFNSSDEANAFRQMYGTVAAAFKLEFS